MPRQSRRRFLVTTGATVAASAMPARASDPKPVLKFGLMADCQYADVPAKGARFYRESPRKLREAVAEFNRSDSGLSFHLGDFIDRDMASFDDLLPITATLKSRLCHLLGNHDFDVPDARKAEVPGKLGLSSPYYEIRHPGFRFVILDTTEVATYRYPANSLETHKAKTELKRHQEAGNPSAKSYNSAISPTQLAWVGKILAEADAAEEVVLVLGHHPIAPVKGHSVWNHAALIALLQKHPCVKAYINGHNHAGAYAAQDGLHYLTLDGMVDTKDTNAFALATLFPDRLEVKGFGRQESHTLKFR